jgi:hypothetical protein
MYRFIITFQLCNEMVFTIMLISLFTLNVADLCPFLSRRWLLPVLMSRSLWFQPLWT